MELLIIGMKFLVGVLCFELESASLSLSNPSCHIFDFFVFSKKTSQGFLRLRRSE
jgi:hypothetical protein